MLDTIPPEVLSHIALHLLLPTCAPPTNLLQTSKTIHNTLSPSTNPRLYSRVYRACFDTSAAERRLGDLKATDLTAELGRRVKALSRLTRQVESKNVSKVKDEDLWVIYIMLIENGMSDLPDLDMADGVADGKNVEHLLAGSFLPIFLRLYHEQHLLPAAVQPGYPAETVGRALTMWIAWLLSGLGTFLASWSG